MGRIINFQSARGGRLAQPPRAYPAQGKAFFGNQGTRDSMLKRFERGETVRKIGRSYPGGETEVQRQIREALFRKQAA